MRISGFATRRAGLIVAAAGLAAGSVLAAPTAQAAPSAPPSESSARADAATLASSLTSRLGARTAGAYLDRTGAAVVTVSDAAAAQTVRDAGAVPRLVARGGAQLASVQARLDRALTFAGTAYAVDPVSNQVLISVDASVTGTRLARVRAVARQLGAAVRVERVAGTFTTRISGGNAIYAGGGRCSLGFNVRSGGTYYFLTAGHCTNFAATWYGNSANTQLLGSRAGSSFPGNDYGIVRYTGSVSHPGDVTLYGAGNRDITNARTPAVGESVQRSGSTTGVRGGRVTALNATVNYAEGRVSGLIRTTVCAQPGDSGGPLFAGNSALGLTSGGSGNCYFGGTTFFQPVTEALGAFGVSVY